MDDFEAMDGALCVALLPPDDLPAMKSVFESEFMVAAGIESTTWKGTERKYVEKNKKVAVGNGCIKRCGARRRRSTR